MGQSHPSVAMPETRAHHQPEHGTCGRADAEATQQHRACARSHKHSSPALAASDVSNSVMGRSDTPLASMHRPATGTTQNVHFRLRGRPLEGVTPQPWASGPVHCRLGYSRSMRNHTNNSRRHAPIDACLRGAGLNSRQEQPRMFVSYALGNHVGPLSRSSHGPHTLSNC